MNGKDIFNIFGHGAIYGHNTLQNLVDLYMLSDPLNFKTDIPFICDSFSRRTKGPDEIQLADLIRTREYFLQNIKKFINSEPKKIEEIQKTGENEKSVAFQIANSFIFPIINIATRSNPKAAEKALLQLSKFFSEHEWNGENDIPELSDKLVLLLSTAFTREDISLSVREETAKIWLDMFSRKGKLDDIILFLGAWLNTSSNVNVDLSSIIESVKKEIIPPSFVQEILKTTFIPFYSNTLVDSINNQNNEEQMTNTKKAAAANGFLYVIDERNGLCKFGTGHLGTIYSSLEMQNKKLEGHKPVGIAVTNDYVILRWENGPLIACDQITLELLFYILDDCSISKKYREIEKEKQVLPSGSFTAIEQKLIFLEDKAFSEYELNENELVFVRKVDFVNVGRMGSNCSIITNGVTLLVCSQLEEKVELFEFSLEDGSLLQNKRSNKIVSNDIAFDLQSRGLFCVSDSEIPIMSILSHSVTAYSFDCSRLFPAENKSQLMELFYMFPSLMISRIDNLAAAAKYQIRNISIFYDVLEICAKKESGRAFINPIVLMIFIYLINHPNSQLPSPKLVNCIWKYIDAGIRPLLIRIIFNRIRSPYDSQSVIQEMIDSFSPFSVISGVAMIEDVDYRLLVALLGKKEIIEEATTNLTHMKYSFLQKLITTITQGYFSEENVSAGMIIPILTSLVPSKSHLFLSLMASMLPVLREALKDPLIFGAVLPCLPSFIKEMHSFIPVKALEDFAHHHMSVCTDQPFSTKVTVDETPHPYHNNTDYVHTYDFKNAIEVLIAFDPATNTEANCDWLQIFSDKECSKPIVERMSGRFNKWKSPILTHSKVISLKFHSDTSVNEWGYRATITQKIFSQQNYESPDPLYDIYYSFYNIIIDNMKRFVAIDDSFMHIDEFDPNDADFDEDLSNKLNELIGTTEVGPLFKLKIAMINHLYKFSRDFNNKEYLKRAIICPFSVLSFDQKGNDKMANQMLFYVTNGVSSENRAFLLNAIKSSSHSQEFIESSLNFADEIFAENEPSLTDCTTAAGKTILAFKLMDKLDKEQSMEYWFKCLSAISRIKTTPNSLTQASFNIIAGLGTFVVVEDSFADEFARRHFDILKKAAINTSEMDAPVVSFVINRIFSLKVGSVQNSTLLDIILRALEFNLPNVTCKVSEMIDKFHVKANTIDAQFEKIISKVGRCFKNLDLKSVATVVFDTKKNFSFALADCLRKLLTLNSLNSLSSQLYSKNALGALIILAARSFPLRAGDKVIIKKHNMQATVTSIDPLKISLITETNIALSIPLIDFRSLTPLPSEIERILPPMLVGADQNLINAVLAHKNNYIALAALSELLPNAKCSFCDVFNQVSVINQMLENEEPKFKEFHEMEKLINIFPENEGIKSLLPGNIHVNAYIYTQPISSYYFEPDGDALFGFCESGNPLPDAAFLIRLTEKSVMFGNTTIIAHETIKRIKLGYLNETMSVYIHTDSTLKPTELFMPPMNNPIPCIITRGKIKVFNPNPLLVNPILDISYQMYEHIPTHVYLSNKLIPIDQLYEDYQCNLSEPSQIVLYPSLSKTVNRYYIEFSFKGSAPCINISNPLQQTLYMYTYQLPQSDFEIVGLLIDNENHFAAVTIDGEVAADSIKTILNEDSLIVFSLQNVSSFTMNKGMMPFLFDPEQQISGVLGEIVWDKPKTIPLCPLQSPLSFKPAAKPQNLATGMMTPYIVFPNEKGGELSGKVGIGMCDKQKVTVFIHGDLTGTITPVVTRYSNVTGVIEKISDSVSSFQRNLLKFTHSCSNSPINDGTLAESNWKRYKLSVLTICLSKAAIDMNAEEEIKFIISTITSSSFATGGKSILNQECFSVIIKSVFAKKETLKRLCKEAMKPFLISNDYFKGFPLYTICQNNGAASMLTLHNANSILFVANSCVLKEPKKLTDSFGNSVLLVNGCRSIFVFRGDTVKIDKLGNDDVINAHIIPLCDSSVNQNLNFSFGINFIAYFIDYIKENANDRKAVEMFDEYVLFPTWKHIMSTETRIFENEITYWLILLLNDKIYTSDMLLKYRKTLNLDAVINDQPSFFTGLLCVISLHLYKGPSLQNFIEHVIDVDKTKHTYASLVFRQFVSDLLNPFGNVHASGIDFNYEEMLSSIVIDALALSRRGNCIIVRSSSSEPSKIIGIDIPDADCLAAMRILPTTTANVSMNQVPITPDCILQCSKGNLKITKSIQDVVPYILQIIPISKRSMHTAEDARNILLMMNEIKQKWTPENEALANCIAQNAFTLSFPYLFMGMPDSLMSLMFPGISPEVARFRCALCFLNIDGTEEYEPLNLDSNLHPLLKMLYSAFIPQKQLVADKKAERNFLPASLPTKNATLSDFFSELYKVYENVACSEVLMLGDRIVGNSSEPVKVVDVLSELENDMFIDGKPDPNALSQTQMSGFLGFGMYAVVCLANGLQFPVDVDDDVVGAVIGSVSINTPQTVAIRLGAEKIETHYPKLKIIREGRYYLKYFTLNATHSDYTFDELSYGASILSSPIFAPYINKLTKGKTIKAYVETDKFEFSFDSATSTLTVPNEETLLNSFK